MRRFFLAGCLVAAASVVLLVGSAAAQAGAADGVLLPTTHVAHDALTAIAEQNDGSLTSGSPQVNGVPICSTSSTTSSNVNTDCEGTAPHNETSVAVNPTNPLNVIEGANDYQLTLNGSFVVETILSRAHVSFDGGVTWTTYPLDSTSYSGTGDPAVAFDASGRAYYATLGFVFGQGSPTITNADILVAHSSDGGKSWSTVRVAAGTGSLGSVGTFNDKEYIAAWGNGNAIVTWTDFRDGIGGSYGGSPIMDSVTHDGGKTWSAPQLISGSAPFCIGFNGGTTCDQDQDSYPVVAADGTIHVVFDTVRETTTFRDQYVEIQVDPTTGARIAGPFKVGDFFDGITDQPVSGFGDPTLHDSQFRTFSFGNLSADPTNASHLAAVWTDMRDSQLPAPTDPYQADTNSDVNVAQSFDGGRTWSSTVTLRIPNDQFQASGAYGTDGLLRIGFYDRSYNIANDSYGYTVATETRWGSLHFALAQLNTALSNPTKNDRWFSRTTFNSAFPHPSSFLGDYTNLGLGGTTASWTDMRNNVCFPSRCGAGEDAYFSSIH